MSENHFYIVPMFPYPSGKLHMGHVRNYAISDAIARHYRRQGYKVLHPIGWDAFGLPAENAARERKIDPRVWTDTNIQSMREQLTEMGFEFDYEHELSTHSPSYIKQGQSLFLRFYQHGLIERREGEVWWDPIDQTVLANEQVIDGRGWRSGAIVERKTLSMLFGRIQDDAVSLVDGLSDVDWPHAAIAAQSAWIGADQHPIRLRDWCMSRQRSWGTPVPLIECGTCGEIPATEHMLPLTNLATQPTEMDRACTCPLCGRDALRSAETLDTFWDSSFYTYCYPDTQHTDTVGVAGPAYQIFGGVDLYVGGLEHATMHLLYARWFARAMRKVGFSVEEEPFKRLIGQGMVCAPAYRIYDNGNPQDWVNPSSVVSQGDDMMTTDGRDVRYMGSLKMSKSKQNGIDPQEFVQQYGAESVRFAMLFAAPFAVELDWTDDIVRVAHDHLLRMKSQALHFAQAEGGTPLPDLEAEGHALSQKIIRSYEGRDGLNAMMGEALGLWRKAVRASRDGHGGSARQVALRVVEALWPIAPYVISEVAQTISPGWTASPVRATQGGAIKPIVVQVNGVKRALIENNAVHTADDAWKQIQVEHPQLVAKFVPHGCQKMIWIKGRIINLIPNAYAPKTPSM